MKKDMDSSVFGGEAKDTGQPSVDGLIAKLEAATAGSRELDNAVANAVGYTTKLRAAPLLTTSLDAALTLLPKRCRYIIEQSVCGRWFDAYIHRVGEPDEFLGDTPSGVKTAAIAVCIAALRARQTVPQTVAENPAPLPNTEESKNNTGGTSDGGRDV